MKFSLEIECENAAFADEPASEIAAILRKAAFEVERGNDDFKLYDMNGNAVGRAKTES
jgi:hypothetical protein